MEEHLEEHHGGAHLETDEQMKHYHLLLLDTTLLPKAREELKHQKDTCTIVRKRVIMIKLIEISGVSVPHTPSR